MLLLLFCLGPFQEILRFAAQTAGLDDPMQASLLGWAPTLDRDLWNTHITSTVKITGTGPSQTPVAGSLYITLK